MAKKSKTFSLVEATDKLEQLGQRGTSAPEFVYELLRIFAGYGEGQVRRTKEGPGNLAKDGETVLIKNLLAYRQAAVNTVAGDCSAMYDVIDAMREDAKIAKHSPRLFITSNGVHVVAGRMACRALPYHRAGYQSYNRTTPHNVRCYSAADHPSINMVIIF